MTDKQYVRLLSALYGIGSGICISLGNYSFGFLFIGVAMVYALLAIFD